MEADDGPASGSPRGGLLGPKETSTSRPAGPSRPLPRRGMLLLSAFFAARAAFFTMRHGLSPWIREGHRTPLGAATTAFVARRSFPAVAEVPADPRMYLIHVGKAGGTTLRKALRLSDDKEVKKLRYREIKCRMKKTRDGEDDDACFDETLGDSELARRTMTYFHTEGHPFLSADEQAWVLEHTNAFLVTVRHPLDRLVSAYDYHRRYPLNATRWPARKRFFAHCFPDGLDALVDAVSNDTNARCTELALRTLGGGGESKVGHHFRYDYRYYKARSLDLAPDRAVAAIRTEHEWEDLARLDRTLGGTGRFDESLRVDHGSGSYSRGRAELKAPNAAFLCCLIHEEVEAYQSVILRAFNLDDARKREALSDLLERCRIEASEGTDPVGEPFSWKDFRRGSRCAASLVNVTGRYRDGFSLLQS